MSYWQGVASRVNILSLVLLIAGAVISFGAPKLAPILFKNKENMVLPMKVTGLVLVVVGALITFV